MSLKPRKQRKHYPYLFLLNEKYFLRYLRGQYVEHLMPCPCSAYYFSRTKKTIYGNTYFFNKLNVLIDKLWENNKLIYAPVLCDAWVVNNDTLVINRMKSYLRDHENLYQKRKTREKRDARQQLRLNTWSSGWVAFENKPSNAITLENPMLTMREKKWWQKGFDDAKEDYEQERDSDSDQYYNLLRFTEKDYDKAEIEIIPYIFSDGIYTLIDGAENIHLKKEDFQLFFTLLENDHNALSVIIESGELQNSCVRLDGTPYLSSLIMFHEFTETIKPLLNPSIEDEINNWKQLGCQYINIDFLQKKSYYHHNTSN
ncbi:hypothetical protein H3N34_17905 [Photobacterium damselae subsp. damselae]|uniref:hypothetical protein n=1 Tax=Photobacterium damselae TaxID=38293 RepID=UPI0015F5552E|nr:hypothetical protein [Photobacterium damselae]MBA5685045.1 hypothetical protein [Photobacterium damselae subsp. damselae]